MDVDVKKLQEALDYIKAINSCNLDELLWDGDKSAEVAINVSVEDFKFMGLTNLYFAQFNELTNT